MNKKIPCIKCNQKLFEYLWPYLQKWGYKEIVPIVSWECSPILVLNVNYHVGSITNVVASRSDACDRELVDDPEEFLARAAKLKGFEYKPNNSNSKSEIMDEKFVTKSNDNFNMLKFLDKYLEGHNGFIAGGCFKNILSGEKVKDIDIFFFNEAQYTYAEGYFNQLVEGSDWYVKYENEKAKAYQKEGSSIWIELIKSIFGTPEFILSNFDFTITKFAYAKADNGGFKVIRHKDYFEHLHMKRLVLDENIPFPVSTWERSYRYKGYGYNLCRESKAKLLDALRNSNPEDEDISMYTLGGWD